jgi:release factor glutamine methyltransferase
MTIADTLSEAIARLRDSSPTPHLDAEVLAMHALGLTRTELIARGRESSCETSCGRLQEFIARRAAGEPVAHITGTREFWSLPLKVTPATLIPRPETELLVERALGRIPRAAAWRIADLGTGSGAVALAIARERPSCHIVATDISAPALEVARHNAGRHGLGNIAFRRGRWLEALCGERFHLIVSNPPYVRENDPHLRQGDVRFEPRTALAGGPDGLGAIRAISADARAHLQPGGWLMLEHGRDQGERVAAQLRWHGYREVATHPDLAGHARVTEARSSH